jgi:hypothetical protein
MPAVRAQAARRARDEAIAPSWSLEELDAPQPVLPVITGCARSGTTLLKLTLDSRSDMAMLPGTERDVLLARRPRRLETDGGLDVDRFVELLRSGSLWDRWELDAEAVRAALRVERPRTAIQAVRRLGAIYARRRNKTRWGTQGPEYAPEIARIARRLPEARFVHLIRDGRDVAPALSDAFFATDNVVDAAVQWRRRVRAAREAGRALGPDRYRELRYEDLVTAPERTLRTLCDFLELDFDQSMLRHHEREMDTVPTHPQLAHHGRLTLPVTPGLRDWRRDLDPATVALLELAAGDVLEELGYPLAGRAPATVAAVRARGRVAVATMRDRWQPGRVKRVARVLRGS